MNNHHNKIDKTLDGQKDLDISNLTGEIAKGGGTAFIGSIIGRIGAFGLQLLIARVLGAGLYGMYVLGVSVTTITHSIASMGLQNGIVRYGAMYFGEDNKAGVKGVIKLALGVSLIISILASFIIYAFSNEISERFFHESNLNIVLKIFAISIPFYVFVNILASFTQSARRIDYQVLLQQVFRPILSIIIVGFLFLLGFRLIGAVYGFITTGILIAGIGFYFLWKIFPYFYSRSKAFYETKKFLRFSFPAFLIGFSYLMMNYIDRLMIGWLSNTKDVGVYNASATIAIQLTIFLNAFITIFSPIVSNLFNLRKHYELRNLFKTVTRWTFSLTLPVFLLIVFFSKNIMSIFGAEFTIGWQALTILALSHLINAATGPVGILLLMSGKQDIELFNGIALLLMNFGLNLWLIPKYGILGAAIGTSVTIAFINIVKLIEVKYILKMHPFDTHYFKPIAAGLVMAAPLYAFLKVDLSEHYQWLWISASTIAGIIGYCAIIYWTGLTKEDRTIFSIIKNKITLTK